MSCTFALTYSKGFKIILNSFNGRKFVLPLFRTPLVVNINFMGSIQKDRLLPDYMAALQKLTKITFLLFHLSHTSKIIGLVFYFLMKTIVWHNVYPTLPKIPLHYCWLPIYKMITMISTTIFTLSFQRSKHSFSLFPNICPSISTPNNNLSPPINVCEIDINSMAPPWELSNDSMYSWNVPYIVHDCN